MNFKGYGKNIHAQILDHIPASLVDIFRITKKTLRKDSWSPERGLNMGYIIWCVLRTVIFFH